MYLSKLCAREYFFHQTIYDDITNCVSLYIETTKIINRYTFRYNFLVKFHRNVLHVLTLRIPYDLILNVIVVSIHIRNKRSISIYFKILNKTRM